MMQVKFYIKDSRTNQLTGTDSICNHKK